MITCDVLFLLTVLVAMFFVMFVAVCLLATLRETVAAISWNFQLAWWAMALGSWWQYPAVGRAARFLYIPGTSYL